MSDNLGKVLIVDDEPSIREILSLILEDAGYCVMRAENGVEALEILKADSDYDLLLTDLRMPYMDGVELFERAREFNEDIEAVIISAYSDVKKAVKAIKLGVFDYLQKDFDSEELLLTVRKAIERKKLLEENMALKQKLKNKYKFEDIIYKNIKIEKLCNVIDRVAPTNASVLITGESGVGKEVFAKAVHKRSKRKYAPFITINCGAIPEDLLESELFGHEKGSFTCAISQKLGKFEIANGGTIFLDEIAETSPFMQTKILRFLQEHEFERVGGLEKIRVDVRIIAATNKDIAKAMEKGEFRDDLYYRLNVINIHIPLLRERRDDILLLAQYFLNQFNQEYDKKIKIISTEVMELLLLYSWPGNVRELKNVIERAVAIANERDEVVLPRHLPIELIGENDKIEKDYYDDKKVLSLAEFEKRHIINILKRVNWNKSIAAKKLGINRQTLYNKLKQYDIQ